MTIAQDGKVGIGANLSKEVNFANGPNGIENTLHFEAHTDAKWSIYAYDRTNSHYTDLTFGGGSLHLKANDMVVGIGTVTPASFTGANALLEISGGVPALRFTDESAGAIDWEININSGPMNIYAESTGVSSMTFDQNGDVDIPNGALSKQSGSFKIDHPLPEKKDTHHLVHSFIEGPRADLVYRGIADLSGGWAQVDLDEASGLSEGTWELLCRDPQCWIQNDSGWSSVRGSVEGNTLTIECKDVTSDDSVSWMVVAERCDPHMYETSWTDDNGRVIVEPEKSEPEEEE
tara:strand:+ start:68 stop:937 length:870 start_codon:yes stop_codon:yes gene_type:complete